MSDRFFFFAYLFLIASVGGVVIISDVRSLKIKNSVLLAGAVAGGFIFLTQLLVLQVCFWSHLLSGGFALVVGYLFYRMGLWRGGDAKLFMLLAFLMPTARYAFVDVLPVLALFINTFLLGLFYLGVMWGWDLLHEPRRVVRGVFNRQSWDVLKRHLAGIFVVSWLMFPLIFLVSADRNNLMAGLISYVAAFCVSSVIRPWLQNELLVAGLLVVGVLLRAFIVPNSFTLQGLLFYAVGILLFSFLATIVQLGGRDAALSRERIPFAPFLLSGCALSYTPFLGWVVSFLGIFK